MSIHPANEKSPKLHTFIWRFITGHHLDGKSRTDATWFVKGTKPSHHVNWWNSKPRFHRMMWRWASVLGPTGWLIAYKFSPVYGINLTVIVTICCLPYVIHHGVYKVLSMIPRHTIVFVHDNVITEDVDTNLDDVMIPEQIEQDEIQEIIDTQVDNATRRKGRRT